MHDATYEADAETRKERVLILVSCGPRIALVREPPRDGRTRWGRHFKFPGGNVKEGESSRDAAVWKLSGELGLEIDAEKLNPLSPLVEGNEVTIIYCVEVDASIFYKLPERGPRNHLINCVRHAKLERCFSPYHQRLLRQLADAHK